MIDNIFSEQQENWNERLKEFVENNGTQTSLANSLTKKYRTGEGKPISQPTISNSRVVSKREGKAPIGFPKFENMLWLPDYLGVDIGYLIGETDAKTFGLAEASKFLHLNPEAPGNFLKATESDKILKK